MQVLIQGMLLHPRLTAAPEGGGCTRRSEEAVMVEGGKTGDRDGRIKTLQGCTGRNITCLRSHRQPPKMAEAAAEDEGGGVFGVGAAEEAARER